MQVLKPSAAPMWPCPAAVGCQHTADCALFVWRNYGPLSSSHRGARTKLRELLKAIEAAALRDLARDLQLVQSTPTADKIQAVLVGYVNRREPHTARPGSEFDWPNSRYP